MRTKESEEMYLETIYLLKNQKPSVRSVDIVESMDYAKSSVSRGVNLLQKKGYITISHESGEINFTKEGYQRAVEIYDRHEVITSLLVSLGAEKKSAEENACRMEHVISKDVFEIIKNYVKNKD